MRGAAMTVRFGDAAAAIQAAGTPRDVQAAWQRIIEGLGFFTFDYACGRLKTPKPRSVLDFDADCYISTLDWSAHYFERGYAEVDPFTRRSLGRTLPWIYEEVFGGEAENARQRDLIGDLHVVGIRSGLALPLHTPGPQAGVMQLGSRLSGDEFARLDRETRPLAALLAACFHERMEPLIAALAPKPVLSILDAELRSHEHGTGPASAPERARPLLSARERECLAWVAAGKTSWEISTILSISEATVNNMIASARRKLGVATRSQAVAKAIARGLIAP